MTPDTVHENPQAADKALPQVDDGLRSAVGIRWLLFVGTLVAGVSMVGVTAAQWGKLAVWAQFAVLAAGAVAVYGLGDLTRHRLRLPVAGSAILFLFAATVPILSWGASFLGVLETPLGCLSFAAGLAALMWATRRVLDRVLEYRGLLYPAALGTLLVALPVLRLVDGRRSDGHDGFFLVAALALGLVLRAGCRHVNRFFFHRDRLSGIERPTHWLPFAVLALVFSAALSVLTAFPTHFALMLAFLGVALVDTGEEYYRAFVQALERGGETEETVAWPRRSVGLLAVGFGLLATALAAAPLDSGHRVLGVVATVAALRLGSWAVRYRKNVAWACGLAAGLIAYHGLPMLIPQVVRDVFWAVVAALGIDQSSPAALSLADLGALALLIVVGFLLRRRSRLTPVMQTIHAYFVAFQGAVVVTASLAQPGPARWLAPLGGILLLVDFLLARRRELMPVLFLAAASTAVCWTSPGAATFAGLWNTPAMFALGVVGAAWLAAAELLFRRVPETRAWSAWVAVPILLLAAVPASYASFLGIDGALLGLLVLANAFLAGVVLRAESLSALAATLAWPIALTAVYAAVPSGWAWTAVALASHFWLAGTWVVHRRIRRPIFEPLAFAAAAVGGLGGLFLWIGALTSDPTSMTAVVATLYPLLTGLCLVDQAIRELRERDIRVENNFVFRRALNRTLFAGLTLAALYVPVQLVTLDVVHHPVSLLLAAGVVLFIANFFFRRVTPSLARFYDVDKEVVRVAFHNAQGMLFHTWYVASFVACLAWYGPLPLLLASLPMLFALARGTSLADLAGSLFLPAFQLVLLPHGDGLVLTCLLREGFDLVPLAAFVAVLWHLIVIVAKRRGAEVNAYVPLGIELFVTIAWLKTFFLVSFGVLHLAGFDHLLLVSAASIYMVLNAVRGWREDWNFNIWIAQGWLAAITLQSMAAGWLTISDRYAALVLLGVAVAETVVAEGLTRRGRANLATPCRQLAPVFATAAAAWSIVTTLTSSGSPWLPVLPGFLASLYFLFAAHRSERRMGVSLAAAVTFMLSLFALLQHLSYLGTELYWLAPGLALLMLAQLLHEELGEFWSGRLFTLGAGCLYATPVLGLLQEVSWGWQIVLLLLAILFGASSFRIRSRSLLLLSTAAVVIDLTFFLLKLGHTAPVLLWGVGVLFGLALMAGAAFLEYRREAVLQQIRVWGQEIRSWA